MSIVWKIFEWFTKLKDSRAEAGAKAKDVPIEAHSDLVPTLGGTLGTMGALKNGIEPRANAKGDWKHTYTNQSLIQDVPHFRFRDSISLSKVACKWCSFWSSMYFLTISTCVMEHEKAPYPSCHAKWVSPIFFIQLVLYHTRLGLAYLDFAKAPGLNDRKSPHISNIGWLAIV